MSSTPRILSVGTIAMVALTSCSLPPREAWRQIQRDGLIPFVATQWSGDPSPAAAETSHRQMMAQSPAPTKQAPAPLVAATSSSQERIGPPVVTSNSTPSPAMIDAAKIPTAQAVPGLTGYVRTPYTNPPRLVDVRGMNAGSKVVCPFTNKPFLVPTTANAEPKVAAAPAPLPEAPKIVAPTLSPTVTAPTTVASMNKPQPSAPPAPAPQVKPQATASAPPSTPSAPANSGGNNGKSAPIATTPPAKGETQDIPYGTPITNRPGFVNSPYAAKHQLVDVTGLPPGMEVKCPYTGKLFRVPPMEQAQSKVPAQNSAAPEKK